MFEGAWQQRSLRALEDDSIGRCRNSSAPPEFSGVPSGDYGELTLGVREGTPAPAKWRRLPGEGAVSRSLRTGRR
jgi:hypothetical protein